MKYFSICLFFCSFAYASSDNVKSYCWSEAGDLYGIDPLLLYSIAFVESSFNPNAINKRSENDLDIGLMQINSYWFSRLSKMGIGKDELYDPCTNIKVGAWVLRNSIEVFGNNWRAVGAYNAGTSKKKKAENIRKKYASKVRDAYLHFSNKWVQPVTK